jgi:hypothetical protein
MNQAIAGGILIGHWVIGLCFWSFRKRYRDQLFGWFAGAFWLLAAERLLLILIEADNEIRPYIYTIRLIAFSCILFGIYDKNRHASQPEPDENTEKPDRQDERR